MAFKDHSYQRVPYNEDHEVLEVAKGEGTLPKSSWLRKNMNFVVLQFFLICVYSIATLAVLAHHGFGLCKLDKHNSLLTYSPAVTALRDTTFVFNAAPNLTSPYVGESRPSLDKAWHELLKNTNLRITEDDLNAVNRTSIPLGVGGGYYGEISTFHELHCLKFIRQAFHMDYYGKGFSQREKETMGEHTEHCIEILRQSVMCRGDTTLITVKWGHTIKLPQPDLTLQHTCVDWDNLMDWASDHSINVFEEGMLVHPTLGPAYPGGFRDDRPPPTIIST